MGRGWGWPGPCCELQPSPGPVHPVCAFKNDRWAVFPLEQRRRLPLEHTASLASCLAGRVWGLFVGMLPLHGLREGFGRVLTKWEREQDQAQPLCRTHHLSMNSGGPAAAFHNPRRRGVSAPHVPPGSLGTAGPAGLGPATWGLFLRLPLGRAESGAPSPWACGPCPPSSLGTAACGAQGPHLCPPCRVVFRLLRIGPGHRSVDLQPSPAWIPLAV